MQTKSTNLLETAPETQTQSSPPGSPPRPESPWAEYWPEGPPQSTPALDRTIGALIEQQRRINAPQYLEGYRSETDGE